jgi:hypothetical protein
MMADPKPIRWRRSEATWVWPEGEDLTVSYDGQQAIHLANADGEYTTDEARALAKKLLECVRAAEAK